MLGSGLGDNQKEPDLNSGLEPSGGKIWGMKRRTFVIVLGIFIIFIVALAAGVGGGVGAAAKSSTHIGALESTKSNPQGSSTPISSSYAPQNCETCSPLVKGANTEIKQPIANIQR